MLTNDQEATLYREIIEKIELPESAYMKAKERYESLGTWLEKSECAKYSPHIFPQGSFRLGTAIRPLNDNNEYDLDLSCELRKGILKSTHTQCELKGMVGREIKAYRNANGVKAPVEEKHRCWRLEYADELSFHMDIVPCIPGAENSRRALYEAMRSAGTSEQLADNVAKLAVSITDDRAAHFSVISDDWYGSNPAGYALWFEDRMSQLRSIFEARAKIDPVPTFKLKSPLQRAVQLLKRHRDQMFQGFEEAKPISIIITTLAARAYNGEFDVALAMKTILMDMEKYIRNTQPKVPNPVNPAEDFADRWNMAEGKKLDLEGNFYKWLIQARKDFSLLGTADRDFLLGHVEQRLNLKLDRYDLERKIGDDISSQKKEFASKVNIISGNPPRPWSNNAE